MTIFGMDIGEQSYPPDVLRKPGRPDVLVPTLTIPDLSLAQGDTDVPGPTSLQTPVDFEPVTGVTGRVTISGGAPLDGKIVMVLPGLLGPGQDETASWEVDGDDLIGTYPGGSRTFNMWARMDETSTNQWTVEDDAPTGDYPVTTELRTDETVHVSTDWTLTIT